MFRCFGFTEALRCLKKNVGSRAVEVRLYFIKLLCLITEQDDLAKSIRPFYNNFRSRCEFQISYGHLKLFLFPSSL